MGPSSLLMVLALFQEIGAEFRDYYDDVSEDLHEMLSNHSIDEGDDTSHLQIHEILQHYGDCRDKEWPCNKHCRLEFRQKTDKCQRPGPGDKCFGIPITYKYTRDFNIDRFPTELGVLSRYPRCWSYLGPLICATLFRPCSHHLFIEKDANGRVKIYLSRFSKMFAKSSSLFYISHAVISAAGYCFVWSLSLFDLFFTLSECSIEGISRRYAVSHSIFECFVIKRENDGVSGVCYYGLLTWWKYCVSILPIMCLALLLIGLALVIALKRKDLLKSLAVKHALNKLNRAGEEKRFKASTRFEINDGDVFACVGGAANGPIPITGDRGSENHNLLPEDSLENIFVDEFRKSHYSLSRRFHYERNFGISAKWTGVFSSPGEETGKILNLYRDALNNNCEMDNFSTFSANDQACESVPMKTAACASLGADAVTLPKLEVSTSSVDETPKISQIDVPEVEVEENKIANFDRESQEEYHEEFLNIVNKLRDELAFQQSATSSTNFNEPPNSCPVNASKVAPKEVLDKTCPQVQCQDMRQHPIEQPAQQA
ncbi:unnamed protein product [Strongylus vulgaris]|uniref:Uncharacterized protein n=1 Tax=Strongylus vulgaris TaxID=40348 RepID=A0A3P7IYV5_STRVU|nr:unnamed protein product [Strongylus vulgaris]